MSSTGSSLSSVFMGMIHPRAGLAEPLQPPHGLVRGASITGARDCAFPSLGNARAASLNVSPADPGLDAAAIERLFFSALCEQP